MQSLSVPGSLSSLRAIADFVMETAASAGLDKQTSYRLRLAVDEIATNIITYGYARAGLQGDLDLHAKIEANTLTISLEDTGVAYDPRQAPIPDNLDLPLEERSIGGLGIYLALQNVELFRYESAGGWNRSIFVVNRNVAPAAE